MKFTCWNCDQHERLVERSCKVVLADFHVRLAGLEQLLGSSLVHQVDAVRNLVVELS